MLEHLDAVLAFAVVMLLLSLLITAFVQVAVSILGLRGKNLQWAISELFQRVSPDLGSDGAPPGSRLVMAGEQAKARARAVLADPVLSYSGYLDRALGWLTSKVAKRERAPRPPPEITLNDLAKVVAARGHLGDPGGGGQSHGGADTSASDAVADIEEKLSEWFDLVMKAAATRFKLWSRWITIAGAVVLAFGFQVDSVQIMQRLSDQEIRAQVLSELDSVKGLYESAKERVDADPEGEGAQGSDAAPQDPGATQASPGAAQEGTPVAQPATEAAQSEYERAAEALDLVMAEVYKSKVVDLEWTSLGDLPRDLGGKLMTVLLLSLGAPFWYGAIGNLVGFRTAAAQAKKDGNEG